MRVLPPAARRFTIRELDGTDELEDARGLFREYRTWLAEHREVTAFDDAILQRGLSWLDEEIARLPGEYAPPGGALLLAYDGDRPFGCAGVRRWHEGVAELKRVYVNPTYRGGGMGRQLTESALEQARTLGYTRVVLDTLPQMQSAIALYRKMGFQPIDPYWAHPVAGALFFEYRFPFVHPP
jgi:ribosomal protein S18 acetylase RimI-like enzyme